MKNNRVFVDVDAIVDLNYTKHVNFEKSKEKLEYIRENNLELVTCDLVLVEALTVLSRLLKSNERSVERITKLRDSVFSQIYPGSRFLDKGLKIKKEVSDYKVSTNDCIYFAICRHYGIEDIFSYDKHWKVEGFRRLLLD